MAVISLSAARSLFEDELAVFKRGEKHYDAVDIIQFEQQGTTFVAKVKASMRPITYDVSVRESCILLLYCTQYDHDG